MDSLVKLAEAVLSARRALDRLGKLAQRGIAALVCGLAAAGFAVTAIGCGCAALWIYALPLVGPVGAPLVTGGVLLLIAIILLLLARGLLRAKPRASGLDGSNAAELAQLVAEHKTTALLAALVLGFIAGGERR